MSPLRVPFEFHSTTNSILQITIASWLALFSVLSLYLLKDTGQKMHLCNVKTHLLSLTVQFPDSVLLVTIAYYSSLLSPVTTSAERYRTENTPMQVPFNSTAPQIVFPVWLIHVSWELVSL